MAAALQQAFLVFSLCTGRDKALGVARAEITAMFADDALTLMEGGPSSGENKVICAAIDPEQSLSFIYKKAPFLGYCDRVSVLYETVILKTRAYKNNERALVRWRGHVFEEEILFEEDKEVLRALDPDQRSFLLPHEDGSVKTVQGYRGHGAHFGRRALPVADCRMLVNLATPRGVPGIHVLDPYAGSGGVLLAAQARGFRTYSVDNDADVAVGLRAISDDHHVGSAAELRHLKPDSMDAIATETPFEKDCDTAVVASLTAFYRVLKPDGYAAMMVAVRQSAAVSGAAEDAGFTMIFTDAVDRKGTAVSVILLHKK